MVKEIIAYSSFRYFMRILIAIVVFQVLPSFILIQNSLEIFEYSNVIVTICSFVGGMFLLFYTLKRLKELELSNWYILLFLIPILNVALVIYLVKPLVIIKKQ